MLYFIVSKFMKLLLMVSRGLKIFGRKNIPKKGAFLLVSNHKSNNDPFVLAAATNSQISFMGKEKLFRNPIANIVLRMLKGYPINREGDPREVLNQTINILKSGRPTAMFPEGTRNRENDNLNEFKKGAALVAIKAKVPVVPVAILGINIKKSKIYALFGEPLQPPENTRENITAFNLEMQNAVGKLIDELKTKIY